MNNEQSKDLDKKESLILDIYKEKEFLLKERELNLKELEIKAQAEINRKNMWFASPLLIAFASAMFGSIGTALFQGYSNLQLERQKFEFSLILKALEGKDKSVFPGLDKKESAKKLSFLVNLGVIKTLDPDVLKKLAEAPEDLPTFNDSGNPEKPTFYCAISNKIVTTEVQYHGNSTPIIQWKNTGKSTSESQFTPERRCTIVSNRLNGLIKKGTFKALTVGKRDGKELICASRGIGSGCDFELFEVPSSMHSVDILEKIVNSLSGRTGNSVVSIE